MASAATSTVLATRMVTAILTSTTKRTRSCTSQHHQGRTHMNAGIRNMGIALAAICAGCASQPMAVRCDGRLEPINAVATKEASAPEARPALPPAGRAP